jgi:glycosyltransferase involved in cell wall biosynthesis
MESAVIFSGPVSRDEVPAYIDAMDICVLPDSNAFGSPIALFEFMAMGKPCIVPDLGPMRDVIDDHVTGFVFPRADYGALKKYFYAWLKIQRSGIKSALAQSRSSLSAILGPRMHASSFNCPPASAQPGHSRR